MIYEILVSIIVVLLALLCIVYNKYKREYEGAYHQYFKAKRWKRDYKVCKSELEKARMQVQSLQNENQ